MILLFYLIKSLSPIFLYSFFHQKICFVYLIRVAIYRLILELSKVCCSVDKLVWYLYQGILTEGEGLVQPTFLLRSASFNVENILLLFYETSYLNEEVNHTESSPSVRVPYLWTTISLRPFSVQGNNFFLPNSMNRKLLFGGVSLRVKGVAPL
jgi:hypothetical protein